ncbi:MAG TPA: ABC transporter permease [Bryobacteraceae bacterium]|nr:ABC transporter permease [Bryobacteraceae bacterium]
MRLMPLLGRFIEPRDVALHSGTSNAVAVISFRVWRSWYQGDPEIVGKTIRVESHIFTIIGVEPEGYSGLIIDGSSDVSVPLFAPGSDAPRDPKMLWVTIYGRLQPGTTLRRAQAALSMFWPHVLEASQPPDYEGAKRARFFARRSTMESAATGFSFLRKRFSDSLLVLLAIVGAVLLIACLNLANLGLAKAAARRHEMGVRAALGASAWDLVRLAVWESVLLSALGATLGLVLAYWASATILHVTWTGLVQIPVSTSPDWRVLTFTGGVALASSLLFAALPAWYAARTDPMESLARRTRSVRSGAGFVGKSLLVAQMALSLVLVVGALLFGKTLERLHQVDVGYRRDHLLTLLLFPLPGAARIQNFDASYQALAEKVRSVPGVESVSYSASAPASEFESRQQVYRSLNSETVQAVVEDVAPQFFETLAMRVLRGREFTWTDDKCARQVAIISQSLASHLFGNEDPIGHMVFVGPKTYSTPCRIVGVVNSARLWKVETADPLAIYRSAAQRSYFVEPLMDVRPSLDPQLMKASVEKAVRSLGHFYSLRTMTVNQRLDSYLTVQRLTAWLSGFFGATALLIACIGL